MSTVQTVTSTSWKAYYCLETLPGITPTNPSFVFLTSITQFNVDPKLKYKNTMASGNLFPYSTQLMAVKPSCTITLQISDLDILNDFINTTQPFTLIFRNTDEKLNVILRGAYVERCAIKATNKADAYVIIELGVIATSIESTDTDPVGSVFANDPKFAVTSIPVQNVQIRNIGVIDTATGRDVIEVWSKFELVVAKKIVRRINPTDGSTRALAHVKTEIKFSIDRAVLASDALTQNSAIIAGTASTLKLELTTSTETWGATLTNAQPTGTIMVDGQKQATASGEVTDSEARYTYSANGITFTSVASTILSPPDAPVTSSPTGMTELFTEEWGTPAEPIVGQPPSGAGNPEPSYTAIFTEDW